MNWNVIIFWHEVWGINLISGEVCSLSLIGIVLLFIVVNQWLFFSSWLAWDLVICYFRCWWLFWCLFIARWLFLLLCFQGCRWVCRLFSWIHLVSCNLLLTNIFNILLQVLINFSWTWLSSNGRLLLGWYHVWLLLHRLLHWLLRLLHLWITLELLLLWLYWHLLVTEVVVLIVVHPLAATHIVILLVVLLLLHSTAHHHIWLLVTTLVVELLVHHIRHHLLLLLLWAVEVLEKWLGHVVWVKTTSSWLHHWASWLYWLAVEHLLLLRELIVEIIALVSTATHHAWVGSEIFATSHCRRTLTLVHTTTSLRLLLLLW